MIFIIDGGSLLNQVPELFEDGKNIIKVIEPFFDRFNRVLQSKGHTAFFILRGTASGTRLPRREVYENFTLMFSNKPGDEEELIYEMVELSLIKDETVVVTDNLIRAERAGFLEVSTLRCSEFKNMLLNAEKKTGNPVEEQELDQESVKYWSGLFGIPSGLEVDLSKTKPSKRDRDRKKP